MITRQAATFRTINMRRTDQPHRLIALAGLVLASIVSGACSLDKQEMPALAGPSGLALTVAMTATPDQLPRDGTSQSIVTATARDAQGRPIAGQRLALALSTNAPTGAGLSQSEVVTGASGQASFAVTAPVSGSLGNVVIGATPVGTNADNATTFLISIAALPTNAVAPSAAFSFTPAAPEVGQLVTFNALTSRDEGVTCPNCTFTWNFGGEGTGTGMIVTHAFGAGGTYLVTLTVTDIAGSSGTIQQTVTVTAPGIPTNVTVTSSPSSPIAGQAATFTASATPATNHRIVSYQFIWGDGGSSTQASAVIQHTYSQGGPYALTLTVRDDLGQSTTINQVVTVSFGLTAAFTTSVSGTTVTFDGSTSSSQVASTITDYAWDFTSDGTYDTNGSSATTSNDYGASGTYRVTLKITDNRGVTKTVSQNVVVP
jgi:PKD repeat protein